MKRANVIGARAPRSRAQMSSTSCGLARRPSSRRRRFAAPRRARFEPRSRGSRVEPCRCPAPTTVAGSPCVARAQRRAARRPSVVTTVSPPSVNSSVPLTGSASTLIVRARLEAALEQRPRERVLDQPLDRRACSGRAPYAGSWPSRAMSRARRRRQLERRGRARRAVAAGRRAAGRRCAPGPSSVSAWKTMISSMRLRNSGRNAARSASVTCAFICSYGIVVALAGVAR